AKTLQLFDKSWRGNSVDWVFTGRIDIENQGDIREIESSSEVIEKMKRPGVAVRLEDRKDAAEIAGLGGAQGGANLGWMMRVIIDDRHTVTRLDLETAIDAAKVFKRGGDDAGVDAHVARSCKSGRRV